MRPDMQKRSNRQVRKAKRGVALIIVLTSLAILAAFSSELSYRAYVDVRTAKNLERQVQAYFHARSAMEIARLVITSQKFVQQILGVMGMGGAHIRVEVWPFASKFVEVFSTGQLAFAGVPVLQLKDQKGVGVSEGGFKVVVTPEDSKVNVTKVLRPTDRHNLLLKMLALLQAADIPGYGVEDRNSTDLIANIIDWVDADDNKTDIDSNGKITEGTGAGENVPYDKYGYKVKNAKFDSVSELHLVDGMTDEVYCKLSKAITVYKTDKVNVNEADPLLLKALICNSLSGVDPAVACGYGAGTGVGPGPGAMGMAGSPVDVAVGLIEMCRQIKKALYMPPFANPRAFVNLLKSLPEPLNQMLPIDGRRLLSQIGTSSRVLRIKATGWVHGTGYTMETVIDTLGDNYLYWREYGSSTQE